MAATFAVDERSWLQLLAAIHQSESKIKSVTRLPVALALPGEKNFPHTGVVDSVDNHFDPKAKHIRFRAVFPNKDGKLTDPALAPDDKKNKASVRLSIGQPRKVLLVPVSAVSSDPGGDQQILVVNADNLVEARTVKLGSLLDGMQVVEDGLKSTDWVITGVEPAKREPMDKTLSPADFVKDVRTLGLKPGTKISARPHHIVINGSATLREQ